MNVQSDNLVNNYGTMRPFYEIFTKKTFELLHELLTSHEIKYSIIEHRTKDIKSFNDKITKKHYQSPLDEITDISGLRVIAYYQDDVPKIVNIIRQEFEIDEENSVNKGEPLEPDRFGYQSKHMIVTLSNSRAKLLEWSKFEKCKLEIQIRTVLQHAWASISHALHYKSKFDIPSELQRKLFLLAGIIELADEQFLELRQKHDALVMDIESHDIASEKLEINIITINNYISKSELVEEIFRLAIKVGFTSGYNEDPIDEIDSPESILNDIVSFCALCSIHSIHSLDEILKSSRDNAEHYLRIIFSTSSTKWSTGLGFPIMLILLFNFYDKIDYNVLVSFGWSKPIAIRCMQVIEQARQ